MATPRQQDVTRYLEATGTAQPIVSVDIRARVRGFLKERHFEEGSVVKQGQLLLVIDEEPFRLQLDQAQARLEEAQTDLQRAEQSRARELAQAQVALDEAALLLAESNERRLAKLVAGRTITQDEYDRADATRKQAVAQLQSSRVSLEQAKTDFETNILSARARAAAARTALRNAQIELGYCRMTAPVTGRISETHYDVGNLVGDSQASLLATIVQLDPIHVYMTLSESDFHRYQRSAQAADRAPPVQLALAGEDDFEHTGQIDYHDPAIDSGTGTIRLRGVFANADATILPGTFAHLRVPIEQQPDALLVPERALGIDQTGQYLLVVGNDDVVEYRRVKSGTRLGALCVVEGAIGPSDRVVVEGLLRARPKAKVTPIAETAALDSASVEKTAALPGDQTNSAPRRP